MAIVLVCGGRDFKNRQVVFYVLDWVHNLIQISKVINGAATGADWLSTLWAIDNEIDLREHPADWKKYGKGAESIRNAEMLAENEINLVIAFPGGNGTQDMVKRAKQKNCEVLEVEVINDRVRIKTSVGKASSILFRSQNDTEVR